MDKQFTNIIQDVRRIMDESAPNDSSLIGSSGSDDSELDSIIRQRAVEAADFVHLHADVSVMALDAVSFASTGTVLGSDRKKAVIPVTGMLRFLTAYASSWDAAVSDACLEGSQEYAMALDKYVGATFSRPAALLESAVNGTSSSISVALLPVKDSDTFLVRYIAKASDAGQSTSSLSVDGNLYGAFINYLAGITLLSLGDQRSNNFIELAYSQLGISPTA